MPVYKRENFEPNFENLKKVINGKIPDRPTLFEFAMNARILTKLSHELNSNDRFEGLKQLIEAFRNAGYDYATISAWRTNTLAFPKNEFQKKSSHSLNSGTMITDRESFEKYLWPDPEIGDYDVYENLKSYLPDGMKIITSSNGGLLENAIDLVGFENLSMMTMMDEELTTEIFDAIGSRLLRFYEIVAPIETVGACIVNDDWGFKNQTMFHPDMLRRWVFPWQKKIVESIHNSGKLAILHSCGQLKEVMDDVINDMQFDAKHSFEDQITPVEEAIDLWGDQISILGGIDMDFLARKSPEEIQERSKKLLTTQMSKGGYGLGSGNSIPDYIPDENYLAMISTVNLLY
jgi:uroporphyrinogen decarboxylase